MQVGTRQGRQAPQDEQCHDGHGDRCENVCTTTQRCAAMDGSGRGRGGRWMRRNKSRGGERADRERSEHATAAASIHAPSSLKQPYSDAVWPAACSLSSVSHNITTMSTPHPIPSHPRRAAKGQAAATKNSTRRESTKRGIGERYRNQTMLPRLFISSSAFPNWGRRKARGSSRPDLGGLYILLAELLQPFWW